VDEFATPNPVPQPESRAFWEGAARGELRIPQCTACGRPHFYPRRFCPYCHADGIQWVRASGRGALHSFTIVHRAFVPRFAGSIPYVPALIDLDEGVRMPSRLLHDAPDPAAIRIGMRVSVRFVDAADGLKVPVFAPADSQG